MDLGVQEDMVPDVHTRLITQVDQVDQVDQEDLVDLEVMAGVVFVQLLFFQVPVDQEDQEALVHQVDQVVDIIQGVHTVQMAQGVREALVDQGVLVDPAETLIRTVDT